MTLHIIVAIENASEIKERVEFIIENEDNLQLISCKEEVYWKDDSEADIYYEIKSEKALSEEEWIQLFDRYLKHNAIFKNSDSLEIDHFSEFGNRNDVFVVLYIPDESIDRLT